MDERASPAAAETKEREGREHRNTDQGDAERLGCGGPYRADAPEKGGTQEGRHPPAVLRQEYFGPGTQPPDHGVALGIHWFSRTDPRPGLCPPANPALGGYNARPGGTMAKKLNVWSSRITQAKSQGASQAMLYATGLTPEDLEKPQVGIASVWFEGNPC